MVSVIIPSYNASLFIRQTIESVLAQSMPDIEIVIVDDGSIDDTIKIIQGLAAKDSRIRYIIQEHGGVSNARNKGIMESRGEYIAFLDHDDLWLPQKLEKQLALFARDSQLGLVFSKEAIIDQNGAIKGFTGGTGRPQRGYVFKDLFRGYFIPISTVLMKRGVFDQLDEWFLESMEMAEEVDLFLRVAYKWKIDYCEEVLAFWRMHPNNDSRLRRELLIKDYNSIIERLSQKIPDFKNKYKKEIAYNKRWIAIAEIENLISNGDKQAALKKTLYFFKIFGVYPKAILKIFLLFIMGYKTYDRLRAVILNLSNRIKPAII